MKQRILAACTTKSCMIAILIVLLISCVPVPAKWNIVLDAQGSNVSDYIFFISFYVVLAISFFTIAITTNNAIAKLLFWLAIGKLIDQFWNPYGYHISELTWDILLTSWTLYTTGKCATKARRS